MYIQSFILMRSSLVDFMVDIRIARSIFYSNEARWSNLIVIFSSFDSPFDVTTLASTGRELVAFKFIAPFTSSNDSPQVPAKVCVTVFMVPFKHSDDSFLSLSVVASSTWNRTCNGSSYLSISLFLILNSNCSPSRNTFASELAVMCFSSILMFVSLKFFV